MHNWELLQLGWSIHPLSVCWFWYISLTSYLGSKNFNESLDLMLDQSQTSLLTESEWVLERVVCPLPLFVMPYFSLFHFSVDREFSDVETETYLDEVHKHVKLFIISFWSSSFWIEIGMREFYRQNMMLHIILGSLLRHFILV